MQRRIAHVLDVRWRSNDVKYKEDATFASFMLSKTTLLGLQKSGFIKPSPVQLQAIPLGLCGFDLIVQAKSGTGKTCVFGVISLERISLDTGGLQVLILAPTREIAVQSCDVLNCIGSEYAGLACYAFIGGIPRKEDEKKLAKCHIAVGTPGRVKQLIELGAMRTSAVRLFVLDEADRLLHESFERDISWIYATLPENKQVIALSATYPAEVSELLKKYLHNPYAVQLSADDPSLLGLVQFYKIVPQCHQPASMFRHKLQSAVEILRTVQFSQCLIFINSHARAKSLVDALRCRSLPADLLVGNQTQVERLTSLARLKGFRCRILVSTDLTARGVDAEQVNLVINFDMPWDMETYLHRTGRAGRYGTSGTCISFVTPGEELELLRSISKQVKLNISPFPGAFSPDPKMNGHDGSGDAEPRDNMEGAVPKKELSHSVAPPEVQRSQALFTKSKSVQDSTSEALQLTPAKYVTFDEAVKCSKEYSDRKRSIVPHGSWLDSIDVELYQSMNRLLLGWRAGFQEKLVGVKSQQPCPSQQVELVLHAPSVKENDVVALQDGLLELPAGESLCKGGCSKQLEVQPPVLEQPPSDESSSDESSVGEDSDEDDSSDSQLSGGYSPDDTEEEGEADSSFEDSDVDDSRNGGDQDSEEEEETEAVISVEPPRYHPAWGTLRQFITVDTWDEAPWCVCQACRLYRTRQATAGSSATTWSCQVFSKYAYYVRQMLMRRSVYFSSADSF